MNLGLILVGFCAGCSPKLINHLRVNKPNSCKKVERDRGNFLKKPAKHSEGRFNFKHDRMWKMAILDAINLMMKHLFTLALALFCSVGLMAQFSIESPDYAGEVPVDISFTDHTVYITNELTDSLYLGWKMVENTCPEEWTYVLCDYGFCYDGLPPSGTMQPVPEGENAFLKLSVFANGVEGSGYIRFWVYESDNQADYQVITFWLNMPVGLDDIEQQAIQIWPNPASETVQCTLLEESNLSIRSMNGQLVKSLGHAFPGTQTIDIADLPEGMYLLEVRSESGILTRKLQRSK